MSSRGHFGDGPTRPPHGNPISNPDRNCSARGNVPLGLASFVCRLNMRRKRWLPLACGRSPLYPAIWIKQGKPESFYERVSYKRLRPFNSKVHPLGCRPGFRRINMLTSGQAVAILSVVNKRRESHAIGLSPPDPARQMPDPGFGESGLSQRAIAAEIGRSQSTVSREISRNSGHRGYRHGPGGVVRPPADDAGALEGG